MRKQNSSVTTSVTHLHCALIGYNTIRRQLSALWENWHVYFFPNSTGSSCLLPNHAKYQFSKERLSPTRVSDRARIVTVNLLYICLAQCECEIYSQHWTFITEHGRSIFPPWRGPRLFAYVARPRLIAWWMNMWLITGEIGKKEACLALFQRGSCIYVSRNLSGDGIDFLAFSKWNSKVYPMVSDIFLKWAE